MLRTHDEEARAKITADIDAIMTAEVRQGTFKIFLTRSKLADYIWAHHSKMWSKCKWNRLDELETHFRDLEDSSRQGEEVDWEAVMKRGPAEVLNQLSREMQKKQAGTYPETEFLHLRHFSSQLTLPGEQEYLLEVLKSPQQIAKAGLKLRNCATKMIGKVSFKSAIVCGIREQQSGKLIGMAEYASEDNWRLKQASAAANQPLPEELALQIREQGSLFIRVGMTPKLSLRGRVRNKVRISDQVYDQDLSDCLSDLPEMSSTDSDVGPHAATILLPFFAAAGSCELVEHFIGQGADPNYAATMRYSKQKHVRRKTEIVVGTSVMVAARLKQWEVVSRLVDAGADPNVKDSSGSSLAKLAAEENRQDILALLRGRDVPVFQALAEHGSVFHIQQLAQHLELKCDKILAEIGHGGRSALMAPVRCGHADMVAYLLGLGCSPNMTDARGQTPLMAACRSNSEQAPRIIRSLLAHGADKDAVWNGKTALMLACARGNVEAAAELLENGIDATLAGSLLVSVLKRRPHPGDPKLASLLVHAGGGGDIVLEHLSNKNRKKARQLLQQHSALLVLAEMAEEHSRSA